MTVSSDLWQANQDLAQACLEHPFVQGIAKGTLDRKKFAYFVGQDAFFLQAYARAYSIVAAKAPDWEGFTAFHKLASGAVEELGQIEGLAAEWGVNLDSTEVEAATRRYTDFLLATAWGSDPGNATAAMSPCMSLYGFLGQKLAQGGISDNNPYADWIRTYSSLEFVQLAQQLETLVERYTSTTESVHSTYRYAMLCERDFFQAAWME